MKEAPRNVPVVFGSSGSTNKHEDDDDDDRSIDSTSWSKDAQPLAVSVQGDSLVDSDSFIHLRDDDKDRNNDSATDAIGSGMTPLLVSPRINEIAFVSTGDLDISPVITEPQDSSYRGERKVSKPGDLPRDIPFVPPGVEGSDEFVPLNGSYRGEQVLEKSTMDVEQNENNVDDSRIMRLGSESIELNAVFAGSVHSYRDIDVTPTGSARNDGSATFVPQNGSYRGERQLVKSTDLEKCDGNADVSRMARGRSNSADRDIVAEAEGEHGHSVGSQRDIDFKPAGVEDGNGSATFVPQNGSYRGERKIGRSMEFDQVELNVSGSRLQHSRSNSMDLDVLFEGEGGHGDIGEHRDAECMPAAFSEGGVQSLTKFAHDSHDRNFSYEGASQKKNNGTVAADLEDNADSDIDDENPIQEDQDLWRSRKLWESALQKQAGKFRDEPLIKDFSVPYPQKDESLPGKMESGPTDDKRFPSLPSVETADDVMKDVAERIEGECDSDIDDDEDPVAEDQDLWRSKKLWELAMQKQAENLEPQQNRKDTDHERLFHSMPSSTTSDRGNGVGLPDADPDGDLDDEDPIAQDQDLWRSKKRWELAMQKQAEKLEPNGKDFGDGRLFHNMPSAEMSDTGNGVPPLDEDQDCDFDDDDPMAEDQDLWRWKKRWESARRKQSVDLGIGLPGNSDHVTGENGLATSTERLGSLMDSSFQDDKVGPLGYHDKFNNLSEPPIERKGSSRSSSDQRYGSASTVDDLSDGLLGDDDLDGAASGGQPPFDSILESMAIIRENSGRKKLTTEDDSTVLMGNTSPRNRCESNPSTSGRDMIAAVEEMPSLAIEAKSGRTVS